MKMNNNQQAIYEIIARAIERPSVTALVVLKRVAGTGKTQIHVTLYSYYCLRMNKN
jgi:primosomal protein N'